MSLNWSTVLSIKHCGYDWMKNNDVRYSEEQYCTMENIVKYVRYVGVRKRNY